VVQWRGIGGYLDIESLQVRAKTNGPIPYGQPQTLAGKQFAKALGRKRTRREKLPLRGPATGKGLPPASIDSGEHRSLPPFAQSVVSERLEAAHCDEVEC
jgi:hypothetical protein